MHKIKSYIKQTKQTINDLQIRDEAKSRSSHQKSIKFEILDLSTVLDFIEQKYKSNITNASDDEIKNMKQDAEPQPSHSKNIEPNNIVSVEMYNWNREYRNHKKEVGKF